MIWFLVKGWEKGYLKMRVSFLMYSVFIYCSTIHLISCQLKCNNQSFKRADSNVAKILSLGQRKFPENNIEVIKYCEWVFANFRIDNKFCEFFFIFYFI
jgi:hypothetical protein